VPYRVEQLAARAEVSVDTVRWYQGRGLLPPPRREGRVAWYDDAHLERLAEIRRLQGAGLTLAVIARLLRGELDEADAALARAVSATEGCDGAEGGGAGEALTVEQLAERSGIPLPLLLALEREEILVPRRLGGELRYSQADVDVARAGLGLLEAGLPLPEVLELARRHHAAVRAVAERAVELFDDHVRQPLRRSALPDEEAAARLVAAFQALLPATTALVTHHFRRTLLAVAQDHIERVGVAAELAAVAEEAARTP
jgi:DNA-binding transcriptional MerR regulator